MKEILHLLFSDGLLLSIKVKSTCAIYTLVLVNNGITIENIIIYHIIINTTTATSIGSINELIRHALLFANISRIKISTKQQLNILKLCVVV